MSASAPLPEIQRYGLTVIYDPGNALVDLVFLHGLNGHPQRTWTAEKSGLYWPSLLPQFTEEQRIRVLVYGYDADISSRGPGVTKDKIHNFAEGLVADLCANRRMRRALERPIIFVAHSLGGLIVKRALISSAEVSGTKTEHLRSVSTSTYGILFFGTPHKGSDLAQWGSYFESIAHAIIPKKAIDTAPQLIEALKTNSETLINIDRQFAQLLDNFHIYFFHEAKPTDIKGSLRFVVEEDSAAPTLPDVERAGIQADHQHMAKFENDNSPGFEKVVDGIIRYADDAPKKIKDRWEAEKELRMTRNRTKAKENYGAVFDNLAPREGSPSSSRDPTPGSSTVELVETHSRSTARTSRNGSTNILQDSSSSPEPLFIVPPGFRANTFFVGMEKELKLLDQRLFEKEKRKVGTASVLLHGQPGVGKTHVARQYVFQHRQKFPGGIFWIKAYNKEEIKNDFWQIQQKVIAKINPELINPSHIPNDGFIEIVKTWFQRRQEWLLIFDGVSDNEKDIEDLHKYIPDSQNSSLIFISRSKRLETVQRLLKPWPVKVAPLRDEDGRKLLFKEAGIGSTKKPRESQIKTANELSRKVGGLPLAITAIAKRLADTHEPIEKFHFRSYSDDPKIHQTYSIILNDLQQHQQVAALNLINLLCFFGPQIPVEMITFGAKALRAANINIKAREQQNDEEDLNITFSILMRHALIERNDPDDSELMSNSRDSLSEPDPIDVINIHAVVQKYWCDVLNDSKVAEFWLQLAVRLFVQSFSEANKRLRSSSKLPRISDYRSYLIHGKKLRDHTHEYEHRNRSFQSIRKELDPTLETIHDEIREREPSSSQESASQGEFQDSIFDRTGSTSSSGHSGSQRRPAPLPLQGHNQYGVEFHRPPSESPMGIPSPDYTRHMEANPHLAIAMSDDEDHAMPHPMIKQLSDNTIRPRTESSGSTDSPWQLVGGKRNSSRRPVAVAAQTNYEHASGSDWSRPSYAPSENSYAHSSLNETFRKSSTPAGGRSSGWFAWSKGQGSTAQPSYAAIAAGQGAAAIGADQRPTSTPIHSPYPLPGDISSRARGRGKGRGSGSSSSRSASRTRRAQRLNAPTPPHQSSTLSRDSSGGLPVIPGAEISQDGYTISQPAANTSFLSDPGPVSYQRSGPTGRNMNPIPYEQITVTPQALPPHLRGVPYTESPEGSRASSRPPTIPDTHPYQNSAYAGSGPLPPEVYFSHPPQSQPMSRDPSSQSRNSDPFTGRAANSTSGGLPLEQAPPRARRADGSPLSKSPKFYNSAPLAQHTFSPEAPHAFEYPRQPASTSFVGVGAWTANPKAAIFYPHPQVPPSGYQSTRQSPAHAQSPFSPPSSTTGLPAGTIPSPVSATFTSAGAAQLDEVSMSRASSGPGIVPPNGLGIAPFGEAGQLTFGQSEPVNVIEARHRAWEANQLRRRTILAERDSNIHSRWTPPSHMLPHVSANPGGPIGDMTSAAAAKTTDPTRRASDQLSSSTTHALTPAYPAGAYTYAPPYQQAQLPPSAYAYSAAQDEAVPWGYSSGYGPASLHPTARNYAAPQPSMPYPETNAIPSEAGTLLYSALAEQSAKVMARPRGNSAPESPGWSGRNFWGT